MALHMPKLLLRLLFGRSQTSSRYYRDIREAYLGKLSGGARATGQFVPVDPPPQTKPEEAQQKMLERWKSSSKDLANAVQKWREADLDRYRLPHPILGRITVREMLMFTLYHNLHHMETHMETGS